MRYMLAIIKCVIAYILNCILLITWSTTYDTLEVDKQEHLCHIFSLSFLTFFFQFLIAMAL